MEDCVDPVLVKEETHPGIPDLHFEGSEHAPNKPVKKDGIDGNWRIHLHLSRSIYIMGLYWVWVNEDRAWWSKFALIPSYHGHGVFPFLFSFRVWENGAPFCMPLLCFLFEGGKGRMDRELGYLIGTGIGIGYRNRSHWEEWNQEMG